VKLRSQTMKFKIIFFFFSVFWSWGNAQSSPVFVWSNVPLFSEPNIQILETVNTKEVSELIASASIKNSQNPLGKYVSHTIQPELVVVYLESELKREQFSVVTHAYSEQPDGGAFSNLKRLVETQSSAVIPYTRGLGSSLISSLAASLPSSASTIFVSNDGIPASLQTLNFQSLSKEEFEKLLQSDWKLLHNGVSDLVIVFMGSSQDDSFVGRISLELSKIGSLSFLAFERVTERPNHYPISHPVMAHWEERYQQRSVAQGDSNSLMPAEIAGALIIMIPFLFILFWGIYWTFSLQSSLKFDAEKKYASKGQ